MTRSPHFSALVALLAFSVASLQCGGSDSTEDTTSAAGGSGGAGGQGGRSGNAGASGVAGKSAAGGASAGSAGSAVGGKAGNPAGGSAGKGGGATAGGAAGAAGKAGAAGSAGAAGKAGSAGSSGKAGSSGSAGSSGKAGASGSAGSSGSAGGPLGPEQCGNGLDDDGNGLPDDGCACPTPGAKQGCFVGDPFQAGLGACSYGQQTCVDAGKEELRWGPCEGSGKPAPESCDSQDNDCNGSVDEGCPCAAARPCETICGDGSQPCDGGVFGLCSAPVPKVEVCDGQDNNCDGSTDENTATLCETVCGEGLRQCVGGQLGPCGAPAPTAELCDNVDNDCDGAADEDCVCSEDQPCETVCGEGVQKCLNQKLGACDAPKPKAEVCDNQLDDDCDGAIDANDPDCACSQDKLCETICGEGVQVCDKGVLLPCNAPNPKFEVCDNQLDDDCDGDIDAVDADCKCTQDKLCETICGEGLQVCDKGVLLPCNALTPKAEVCDDGVDDDCDGTPDNGCSCTESKACETICGTGVQPCEGNVLGPCDAPQPQPEVCDNGLDDDCDGDVDLQDPECNCQTDVACASICGGGLRLCVGGVLGPCDAPQPQAEICGNGQDDDCNGAADDGCCVPTTEVCDGVDNNCNGLADENGVCGGCQADVACATACGAGVQPCVGGVLGACNAPQPQPEICGNNFDDNCNGAIDEGCGCTANVPCQNVCGTPGTQVCSGGVLQACDAPPPPQEVCDGVDNNCNGLADEGLCCEVSLPSCGPADCGPKSNCLGGVNCSGGCTVGNCPPGTVPHNFDANLCCKTGEPQPFCNNQAYCGSCPPNSNGVCDPGETCESAPLDCKFKTCPNAPPGQVPCSVVCGCNNDGNCHAFLGENTSTCPSDCGGGCGNGKCDGNEDCATCALDCGTCPKDGDGNCESGKGESCINSPLDCGSCCGNGKCDNFPKPGGEGDTCACDECKLFAFCVNQCNNNGVCDTANGENGANCNADCCNKNGVCDSFEDAFFCPADCTSCGDGTCNGGESCSPLSAKYCPGDCPPVQDFCFCGNNTCESSKGENVNTCPQDCPVVAGDGICSGFSGVEDCSVADCANRVECTCNNGANGTPCGTKGVCCTAPKVCGQSGGVFTCNDP